MTTKGDSSFSQSTAHASQYYADFSAPISSSSSEELSSSPVYTVIPITPTENNVDNMKSSVEPSTVIRELVNQRFSSTTQRQLNSQQVLRITQYIDKQEKAVNDKLAVALIVSIIGIVAGLTCIGLFIAYHYDLCGHYQTTTSCGRTYTALIVGCISIFLGVLRIIIYCSAKVKISRAKKIWQERVIQIQQASVHGY